jgi:hypothetical protein
MGSPPPAGSKKDVLKLRSVKSIVMPPANTGNERTSKIAVKKILQINKGIFSHDILGFRKLIIVQRKLILPPIEEAPAICNLKIAKSTLIPGCPTKSLMGG